jgi:nickel-dependent lactate racemase
VRFLGEMNILTRIAHMRFVQNRIHRIRQRLINAAAGHYVAAQEKAHELK